MIVYKKSKNSPGKNGFTCFFHDKAALCLDLIQKAFEIVRLSRIEDYVGQIYVSEW